MAIQERRRREVIYAVVVFVPEPEVEEVEGRIDGLLATNDFYWDDDRTREMAEYHYIRTEMETWREEHHGELVSPWTLTHLHTNDDADLSKKYWFHQNYWLTAFFSTAGEAARFKLVNAYRLVEE